MPKARSNKLVDMLTSRLGALLRNSKWNQHVHLLQIPRLALPPDEPDYIGRTKPLIPARLAVVGETAPAIAMPYCAHACWLVSPDTGAPISPPPVFGTTKPGACSR